MGDWVVGVDGGMVIDVPVSVHVLPPSFSCGVISLAFYVSLFLFVRYFVLSVISDVIGYYCFLCACVLGFLFYYHSC